MLLRSEKSKGMECHPFSSFRGLLCSLAEKKEMGVLFFDSDISPVVSSALQPNSIMS